MKTIEERVAELTYEYGTNTDLDGKITITRREYNKYVEHSFRSGVEFAQQWISVDDELPKESGWYLCKTEKQNVPEVCHCDVDFESVGTTHIWSRFYHPTHWRPININ